LYEHCLVLLDHKKTDDQRTKLSFCWGFIYFSSFCCKAVRILWTKLGQNDKRTEMFLWSYGAAEVSCICCGLRDKNYLWRHVTAWLKTCARHAFPNIFLGIKFVQLWVAKINKKSIYCWNFIGRKLIHKNSTKTHKIGTNKSVKCLKDWKSVNWLHKR